MRDNDWSLTLPFRQAIVEIFLPGLQIRPKDNTVVEMWTSLRDRLVKSNKTHRIKFLFANSLLSTIKKVSEVLTKWRQIRMKWNIEENWARRAKDQATVYHSVTNTWNSLNCIKSRRISVEETNKKGIFSGSLEFLVQVESIFALDAKKT